MINGNDWLRRARGQKGVVDGLMLKIAMCASRGGGN